ncbi:MAG: DUF5685 family protein [Firmicutes bacterium]|nr:DUF5685 family protein [Bacillota bacterium]
MFGYVVINKPELKFREFDEYRGFYCGLCHSLKQRYGIIGQLTLNYDLTFLAIVLTALYEEKTIKVNRRCIIHPLHKMVQYENKYIDYCADMTILLSYYKCLDDISDERSFSATMESKLLKNAFARVSEKYPDKKEFVEKQLLLNQKLEEENCHDIDSLANLTGKIMACLFNYQNDEWSKYLKDMGFYLGKFIYLMDAYEDVEKDVRNKQFNIFKDKYQSDSFDDDTKELLMMMIAKCTNVFEILPILQYHGILINVLYSGVWTKLEMIRQKKEKANERSL